MRERVWVVEARYQDGKWYVPDHASNELVSTNFFTAHKLKREVQRYLINITYNTKTKTSIWDNPKRFRVKEYKRLHSDQIF